MNSLNKKIILYSLNILIYFGLFSVVSAVDYTLLEPLGDITEVKTGGFSGYLSSMFKLSISIAMILAVLQISIGGFQYITTETFIGKSDAQKKINNAVIGLVLILASFLLLRTINPDLVENRFEIPSVSPEVLVKETGSGIVYYDYTKLYVEGTGCPNPNEGDELVLVDYEVKNNTNYHTCYYNEKEGGVGGITVKKKILKEGDILTIDDFGYRSDYSLSIKDDNNVCETTDNMEVCSRDYNLGVCYYRKYCPFVEGSFLDSGYIGYSYDYDYSVINNNGVCESIRDWSFCGENSSQFVCYYSEKECVK